MSEHDEDNERDANGDPLGHAAIDAVATAREPTQGAMSNALAFFMGDVPPPNRDKRMLRDVDFGTIEEPNFQPCVFRPLANEELVKAEMQATVDAPDSPTGQRLDSFIYRSYVFAYSLVEPALEPALGARRAKLTARFAELSASDPERAEVEKELHRLTDPSALVREVFRFQPGVLQAVSNEIEEQSRLGQAKGKAIREVEAGKG